MEIQTILSLCADCDNHVAKDVNNTFAGTDRRFTRASAPPWVLSRTSRRSDVDHRKSQQRLEKLLATTSPNRDEIEILSILMEKWKEQQFAFSTPMAA